MALRFSALLTLGLFFSLLACTPKTGEQAASTEEPAPSPAPVDENLSPCPKFSDAPYPDDVETNYVLYRDFLRAGDYTQAFDLWKKVYAVSPAADGKRNTVFSDGIFFYERLANGASTPEEKKPFIDRIFQLYEEINECYPEGGYVDGRKAFDYYYKYPDQASKEEIYALFKKSLDADGMDAQYFVLNPFTALLVEQYFAGAVSLEEAQKYQTQVRSVLAKGLEECKGKDCEQWTIIEGYVPVRLEAFETVKGFYDCDYYMDRYYQDFTENPTNCDVMRTVYSRLKFGGCPETSEAFKTLIASANENCREEDALQDAYECLRNADYDCAIELFQKAADEETDVDKKAKITLLIAKVYYSHKKNFSKARSFARDAAKIKKNWGEPYLLIGRLYASSGPLCGPGRGWDSQIVVWPAIDKWAYAKSIDPSAAAEANKWISRYRKYMPSREDIFQRNLTEGSSFYVGCWIQETTKIRAAPN